MNRFSRTVPSDPASTTLFSPDRTKFIVLTSRGNLTTDRIESRLWLFETRAVQRYANHLTDRAPSPRLLTEIAAVPKTISYTSYSSVISDIQWATDSRSVYFLGQDSHGIRHLYCQTLTASPPSAVSPEGYDVIRFLVHPRMIPFVAVNLHAQRRYAATFTERINADARVGTGASLQKNLFPDIGYEPKLTELWAVTPAGARHISRTEDELPKQILEDPFDRALSVSPDGNQIVQLLPVTAIPESWDRYQPAPGLPQLRIRPRSEVHDSFLGVSMLNHFVLTDVRTRVTTSLVTAPVGRHLGYYAPSEAIWSPNGSYLLLTNTYLPLGTQLKHEEADHVRACMAAVWIAKTKTIQCLLFTGTSIGSSLPVEPSQLKCAIFDLDSKSISLRLKDPSGPSLSLKYQVREQNWQQDVSEPAGSDEPRRHKRLALGEAQAPAVALKTHESLNVPPTLQVTVSSQLPPVTLWDPNPQLHDRSWGEASVFHWKDRSGYQWTGGLVKPVDYVPGMRYPLVIQMYQFRDGEFVTDGMAPTAMPARALASAGIMFLQASRKPGHTWNQTEAQEHLDGTLSAIDTLAEQGLIDPARVGLIGFSFTTWYVENELIKAPNRFAAATIADGSDNSYMQYRVWGISSPGIDTQAETINGAKPYGEGLRRWMETAPGFNLDKVQSPLRIEAIAPGSLIGEWEIYASLRQQHKPVDLIYFPEGQHQLQRPLERLASAEGNVDWFRYWLQGYTDPSPHKASQYARWKAMSSANGHE